MRCGAAGERKHERAAHRANGPDRCFVEAALRRLGFTDLRLRHQGDLVRIELAPEDVVRAVTVAADFRVATVDLAGCSRAPSRVRSCTRRLPDELQAPRDPSSTELHDAVA